MPILLLLGEDTTPAIRKGKLSTGAVEPIHSTGAVGGGPMAVTMKQHDDRPAAVYDLKDNFSTTKTPLDLTDATSVTFKMRLASDDDTVAPKVSRAMTVLDAANGRVQHDWLASDTDTVGTYNVEFEIVWSDSGVETVPNDGYMTVIVQTDLDQN